MNATPSPAAWSPLYFLSALGAGGMAVSFFMFLMFWVPHPGQPVPVFEDWTAALSAGSKPLQLAIVVALVGIAFFVFQHLKLLVWNLRHWRDFKASGAASQLHGTNAHTQQLAVPLTLAMTVNTLFIVGLVFVPGLWSITEYLFPFAILAFLAIGVMALRMYLHFFGETLTRASFKADANNSLAQMLPSFAFSMVGVGLAAPAAMSRNPEVITVSLLLASFFVIAAAVLGGIKLLMGMNRLFEQGASLPTLPTLWVLIPILTVLGIATLRLQHGLHTLEISHGGSSLMLLMLIFMTQLLFALLGWAVMSRMRYFQTLLRGEERSPVAFAAICPGVATVVMGFFFLNRGLVASGLVEKFSLPYLAFTAVLILLQLATGWLLLRLSHDIRPEGLEPAPLAQPG